MKPDLKSLAQNVIDAWLVWGAVPDWKGVEFDALRDALNSLEIWLLNDEKNKEAST